MIEPTANDGVGWNRIDGWILWLLPAFLGYLGAEVGHEGWKMSVLCASGLISGIAVVRGIEASMNAHMGRKPQP